MLIQTMVGTTDKVMDKAEKNPNQKQSCFETFNFTNLLSLSIELLYLRGTIA